MFGIIIVWTFGWVITGLSLLGVGAEGLPYSRYQDAVASFVVAIFWFILLPVAATIKLLRRGNIYD